MASGLATTGLGSAWVGDLDRYHPSHMLATGSEGGTDQLTKVGFCEAMEGSLTSCDR